MSGQAWRYAVAFTLPFYLALAAALTTPRVSGLLLAAAVALFVGAGISALRPEREVRR